MAAAGQHLMMTELGSLAKRQQNNCRTFFKNVSAGPVGSHCVYVRR
jgi:hypothetical protein